MSQKKKFSAGEQALGYVYQLRYALYALLKLREEDGIFIERDDDVNSVDASGAPTLNSLKHKKPGDTVNDLSEDFWKSVRVWLARYREGGTTTSIARFFMVTTATVSPASFVASLLQGSKTDGTVVERALKALESSTSHLIVPIREDLKTLSDTEQVDFFSRITVFDASPRIGDLPGLIISEHLKGTRRKFRKAVFERLEGWWVDQAIKLIDKEIPGPLMGAEVWDQLIQISNGYRDDDLPINFRGKRPPKGVDAAGDGRLFVRQLRDIGLSTERIESAIIDYYRAFEQRSSWAREDVLMSGEVEEYEGALVEEWSRYKAFIMESVAAGAADEGLAQAGREIYKWAEFNTGHIRIRKHVDEPYVVRGGFHILANEHPKPRVYWHPRFLERLGDVLEARS
jgi:hypothetical protein